MEQDRSLSTQYSFKERILIRIADLALYFLIWTISSSCRFEVRGMENHDAIYEADEVPIYASWHDRALLCTYFWRNRNITAMVSQSRDGEYLAQMIRRFGHQAIRGSSSRGGVKALVEMIKRMRAHVPMGFALDGPRGPRYEVKPGPVMLAKKTGFPVLPFIIEPKRYWQLGSWDKMQIPVPFSKAMVFINPPIYVYAEAKDIEIEAKQNEIQNSMDELVAMGNSWREGQS